MIKVVVFDVDNTLIDSIGAVKGCIEAGAKASSITLPDNFMDLYYEADKFICDEIKAGRLVRVNAGLPLWGGFLRRLGCEEKYDEFVKGYSDASFSSLKTIDGAEQTLDYLHKKYPLAIASNSSSVSQKRRLEKVNLLRYFDKFCFSGDLGYEKPNPKFFETLISSLGVNADEIFYIGDSYRVDIEGAKNCGITTCWYDYFKSNQALPLADYTVTNLKEIISLL